MVAVISGERRHETATRYLGDHGEPVHRGRSTTGTKTVYLDMHRPELHGTMPASISVRQEMYLDVPNIGHLPELHVQLQLLIAE